MQILLEKTDKSVLGDLTSINSQEMVLLTILIMNILQEIHKFKIIFILKPEM